MFESSMTTPPPRPDWLPWTLSVFGVACAVFVLLEGVLPARSANEELTRTVAQLETRLAAAERSVGEARSNAERLAEKYSVAQKELGRALQAKEKAVAELEAARRDLTKSLESQIAAGDVLVEERGGRLVIDVADQLLFDTGEAEVTPKGRLFLKEVAASMKRLPATQTYQVGGHTDSRRIKSRRYRERYPTNWELSTSRATNVARFLEEEGGVGGKQLVAAGFSHFRPVASNASSRGRRKNRRIEIVLLEK